MKGLLVVNADDLGLSHEINSGILWGIEHGLISDTSLLSKAPYAGVAATGLNALGIRHAGIHINLDEVLGFRPGGIELHARPVLMGMMNDPDFLKGCIHEVRGQIEVFLSLDLIPTHMDTHHHVHGFLPIFEILLGLLSEYNIPALRFSRNGYSLPSRDNIPYDGKIYARMEDMLMRREVFFCTHFLEGAYKAGDAGEGVTELVVHPSMGGEPWRSKELEFLRSGAGVDNLGCNGIRMVSFRNLLQEGVLGP